MSSKRARVWMMIGWLGLGAVACGDDDTNATGGAGGGAGGQGLDCEGVAEPEVIVEALRAAYLSLAGDTFVYAAYDETGALRTIRRVGIDGTGDALVFEPPSDFAIEGLGVAGSDVVFLLQDGAADPKSQLYKVPIAGGAETAITMGDPGFETPRLAALDTDAAYVVYERVAGPSEEQVLVRVDLATGTITEITKDTTSTLTQFSSVGSEVFYLAGDDAGGGKNRLFKVPKMGVDVVREPVGDVSSDVCGLSFGVHVFDAGIASQCSGEIVLYDAAGTTPRTLLPDVGQVVTVAEGTVFATIVGDFNARLLVEAKADGSAKKVLACDRMITRAAFEELAGFYEGRFEVIATNDALYWLELNGTDQRLVRAAR